MASSRVCLLAALCSLIILSTFISSTQSVSCCLMYSRRQLTTANGCQRLLGYSIQTINNSCDINAVIFHVRGRFVCADPSAGWTQRAVECVDERRRKNAEILREITQNSTSA